MENQFADNVSNHKLNASFTPKIANTPLEI